MEFDDKSFEEAFPEAVVEEAKPPLTIERAKRMFREALVSTQQNDVLCVRDSKFYHGDQISAEEKAKLNRRGQPEIYINRLAPALNGILGMYDAGETDPQAYPRNPENQNAADIATKLLRFLADKAKLIEIRRVASENYFIEGTCAVLVGDGAQQGDKSLKVTPILWEDFFSDPLSRFHDFSDARYLGIAKWMDTDDVETLYPEEYAKLGNPFDSNFGMFESKNDEEERIRWIDTERRRIRVVEMYYIDAAGQWLRLVFCHSGFLDFGPSVYKDDEDQSICPIVATSYALRRDTGWRYGALRHAVDPQREINSRRSKLLHLTNSRQVQITHEGADPKKAELARAQASRPDGVIPFGYQATSAPDMAEGQMLILQESQKDIDRMAPTPAALGAMDADASGRAREMLQKAGYTEWARAFARLEVFELEIYKRLWWGARQFITEQMQIRITGEMRAPQFLQINVPQTGMVHQPVTGPDGQPVQGPDGQPLMHMTQGVVSKENDIAKMDLDITIGTVPDTPTLEMEVWQELLRYAASMQVSVTDPAFKFLIMASPLPNKTATLERMDAIREQATQETAQAQQQAQQMAEQKATLDMQHTQSRTAKDIALANKANADAQRTKAETYEIEMAQHFARGFHGLAPPVVDPNHIAPLPHGALPPVQPPVDPFAPRP